MKRVIYVCNLPLTAKRATDLFVNELMQAGIPVEYWDISRIQFRKNVHLSGEIESEIVAKIDTKYEVARLIKKYKDQPTVFITDMSFGWRTLWLFRLYRSFNCFAIYLERGWIPSHSVGGRMRRVLLRIGNGRTGEIWEALLDKVALRLMRMGIVKGYDVAIVAGSELARMFKGMCRVIECNHFDYDKYMELKKISGQKREGYAVFLGQNHGMHNTSAYHSDPMLLGMEPIDPEVYQRGLNRFFDLIEERFGITVVIAAHPKSNYRNGVFDGREIVKNRTGELVRDCDFVLGHASTALSYAVLFHKPVILLFNNEQMKMDDVYLPIIAFSEALHAPIYNVDGIERIEQIAPLTIDTKRYSQYKYRYLTFPGTEERMGEDIFFEFLLE